jgi:glutamate formiminotransferase
MQKVIECVPNFSEGQRKEVIFYCSNQEIIQDFHLEGY